MPNCNLTAENLSEWFATPQGGYVLEREQAYFDRTVSDIFGYNALQLGLPEHDFLRGNRMPLRINGGNQAGKAVRARHDVAEPSGAGGVSGGGSRNRPLGGNVSQPRHHQCDTSVRGW